MSTIREDANAVLLPICEALDIVPWLERFLVAGGRSFIMATSGEEYAARRISDERRNTETAEAIRAFTERVASTAGAPVLVAVDAEPTGVERLEHLLPEIPAREVLAVSTDEALTQVFGEYGKGARSLGVSLFLGPVVDNIAGTNDWLRGRILADDLDQIARIAALYVEAVEQAGVTATAKHFPGHPDLLAHPVYNDVNLSISSDDVEANIAPFRVVVDRGVGAVMLGPVTVDAIDPENPAATSSVVVNKLRDELGFCGLVISDDLDAVATMKARSLGEIAVASLGAGVELLLIPGGDHVEESADAIEQAVIRGTLSRELLASAANKIRFLAEASAPCRPQSAVPG